jgi:hypothetical protein
MSMYVQIPLLPYLTWANCLATQGDSEKLIGKWFKRTGTQAESKLLPSVWENAVVLPMLSELSGCIYGARKCWRAHQRASACS